MAAYELTGINKERLEEWVRDHPLTDDDKASEPVPAVDADGMIYWAPAPWRVQVEYLIAEAIWKDMVGE